MSPVDTQEDDLPQASSFDDGDFIRIVKNLVSSPDSQVMAKSVLKTYLDTLYGTADGWIVGAGTWTYSSADSPVFVISVNTDLTGVIGVGDKIKLTQTTVKYFIVHAITFSSPNTLITVYGGTDFTLANAAISSPYYSHEKAPFGFPASPAKWQVSLSDTTERSQATPTQNTWYNLGSLSISIPIGVWWIQYKNAPFVNRAAAGTLDMAVSLSTANNSESTPEFTSYISNGNLTALQGFSQVRVLVAAASKTTYYIVARTTFASISNLYLENQTSALVVKATSAYL